MGDWRINEKYRKPRRAKGTPFFKTRNYWAAGVFAIGGLTLILLEYLPMTSKLRKALQGEKFDYPEGLQLKIKHTHLGWTTASMEEILAKAREREINKHAVEEEHEASWFTKLLKSKPDLYDPSISKYFQSIKYSKDNSYTFSMDSPYRNIVSEIKLVQPSDDDFKTPKIVKKAPKIIPKKKPVSKKKKDQKPSNKIDSIFKRTKDNFRSFDVNPDHLQLALGLSRSTYEAENPGVKCNDDDDLPTFLCSEKMPSVRTTLEKYGFKRKIVTKVNQSEIPKKRIYSRFQFTKPILLTRKNEVRESLINSKVALIIKNCHSPTPFKNNYELFSSILKNIFVKESRILSINSYGYEEIVDFDYYLQNLKIPRENSSCGCLLKNWSEIPGRDKSPVRRSSETLTAKINHEHQTNQSLHEHYSINIEKSSIAPKCVEMYEPNEISIGDQNKKNICEISNSNKILHITEKNTCVSPNLFDSYVETCSPRSETFESFDTISKVFESERGIEHFEGYDHVDQTLCEQVYNLNRHSRDSSVSADSIEIKSVPDNSQIITSKEQPIYSDNCLIYITSDESDCEEAGIKKYSTSIKKSLDNELYTDAGVDAVILDKHDDEELPSYSKYLISGKYLLHNNSVIDLSDENEEINITSQFQNKINKSNTKIAIDMCKKNPEYITNEMQEDPCFESDVNHLEEEIMKITQSSIHSQCNSNQNNLTVVCNEKPLADDSHGKIDIEVIDTDMHGETPIFSENKGYGLDNTERISISRKSVDNDSINLNVTEYITNMLNSQHTYDVGLLSRTEKIDSLQNELSQSSSQESIVISDEELNYSSLHSNEQQVNLHRLSNNDVCVFEECKENIDQPDLDLEKTVDYQYEDYLESPKEKPKSTEDYDTVDIVSSPRSSLNKNPCETAENVNRKQLEKIIDTPTNKLIIKTRNITPLPNYDQMESPQLLRELKKFGVKPLKRKRSIMLLKYIYESTHPITPFGAAEELSIDEEEDNRVIKRRNTNDLKGISRAYIPGDFVGNDFIESILQEELIFERKTSSKVKSCRIPLQIAFFNFLTHNPELRENILLYEPLHVEVVNSMLKEQSGCKFHLEDFITFLDRKCITFRTSQSQGARTKKRF